MNRIVYWDLGIIDNVKRELPPETAPEIIKAVDQALENLIPDLRNLIRERYYEGLTLPEIAERNHLDEKEIVKMLYEAKRQLKIALADFVRRRWGIVPNGICRICVHPSRSAIEVILRNSKCKSWRTITESVRKATGEKFHPPQILKAHLKHMKTEGAER